MYIFFNEIANKKYSLLKQKECKVNLISLNVGAFQHFRKYFESIIYEDFSFYLLSF